MISALSRDQKHVSLSAKEAGNLTPTAAQWTLNGVDRFSVPGLRLRLITLRLVSFLSLPCRLSALRIRKDGSSHFVLVHNGKGSYGTDEWRWCNGTSRRHNKTAERNGERQRQHVNGRLETMHQALGLSYNISVCHARLL